MKKLCKADSKEIGRCCQELLDAGFSPRYFCRKCARVALEKGRLCDSVKIKPSKKKK
ncbi:MAG: hypothetical protein UMU76_07425 [Prosthecochloris sp.]|nr:hypothetical protein [Prosthecochloris sp.]